MSTFNFEDFEFENATLYCNKKTQKNPVTNEITEFGVTGDIAGLLIAKLNAGEFYDVVGSRNSSIKNILSINEFTYDETIDLQSNLTNIVQRQGNDFFLYGSATNVLDQKELTSNLNIMIIKLFLEKQVTKFMDGMISENNTTLEFRRKIDNRMQNIKKSVKKYMKDFDYKVEYGQNDKLIDIYLYESYEKPISKIAVNCTNVTITTE